MLFQTTQAHEELRAKIRAFAEEEVKPIAFSLDQANEFPADAVRKLCLLYTSLHCTTPACQGLPRFLAAWTRAVCTS